MLSLNEKKATIHKFGNRTYYVFPKPPTHANYVNRPTKYVKEGETRVEGATAAPSFCLRSTRRWTS